MKSYKIIAKVCFLLAIIVLISMFITAAAIKGGSWTVLQWIKRHFWYGYYWFVLGSALFAGIGIFFSKRKKKIEIHFHEKHPKLAIILLILLVLLMVKGCTAMLKDMNDGKKNDDTCGVCDGAGLVPKDKGLGYTTCPLCKGAGIRPR